MGRKVFISFLGFTNYEAIRYAIDDNDAISTIPLRFVQEATLLKVKEQFDQSDKVFILTTQGALKNWYDGEHQNFKSQKVERHEGLHSRLRQLNLLAQFKNINIKDGQDTDEIWSVFNIIFDLLEENDELYFDITHGFRTLPMLNMVLINYAKLLKNITVNGIFYGAYEAKKTINEIEYAPIWDLKSFVDLQDWTNSAATFLSTGDARNLSKTILEIGLPILSEKLINFTNSLKTNRLAEIVKGKIATEIAEIIENNEVIITEKALSPILDKVKAHFLKYETDNVLNGLFAIEWCLKNELTQQAYTLMSEFLVSYLASKMGLSSTDLDVRNTISSSLSIKSLENFNYSDDPSKRNKQLEIISKIGQFDKRKKLVERYNSINLTHRNDINHAGMRENPKTGNELIVEANNKFQKLKDVIEAIENDNKNPK